LLRAIEVSVEGRGLAARERCLALAVFPEDKPIPDQTLKTNSLPKKNLPRSLNPPVYRQTKEQRRGQLAAERPLITYDANDPNDYPDGYSKFGWFPLRFDKKQVGRDAPIAVPRAADGRVDLFAITPNGAVVSTTDRTVDIVYLANPTRGTLDKICAILTCSN
jgi:hypothetical protein